MNSRPAGQHRQGLPALALLRGLTAPAAIRGGVDRKWNHVNYLDADLAFRNPKAVETLTQALHRALGLEGRTQ